MKNKHFTKFSFCFQHRASVRAIIGTLICLLFGSSQCVLHALTVEQNGIVIFDVESAPLDSQHWRVETTIPGFKGSSYYVSKTNSSSSPGKGTLEYSFMITTSGDYQYQHRSYITDDNGGAMPPGRTGDHSNNTINNDAWVRIVDENGNSIPAVGPVPGWNNFKEGKDEYPDVIRDNWYKAYMNTLGKWHWQASNQDNAALALFWSLEAGKIYTLEVSARSRGHAIDSLLLWERSLNPSRGDKITGASNNTINDRNDQLSIIPEGLFIDPPRSQFPQFDTGRDILLAQFDSFPDADDLHSQAALGSMLLHPDLAGVEYYAVLGAIGNQSTATQNFIDSTELMSSIFGPQGADTWTFAFDGGRTEGANWSLSIDRIKARIRPIIEAGGKVWVQEAGQSNITADWIRELIEDGLSEALIKSSVIVVQHSWWNSKETDGWDENSDLSGENPGNHTGDAAYVIEKAQFLRIPDGNHVDDTRLPLSENLTPDYHLGDTNFMNEVLSGSNPNASSRTYWSLADTIIEASGFSASYSKIDEGGVDFSDCVENWWIFDIGTDADTVRKFWDRYVVNVPGNEAGVYFYDAVTGANTSDFTIDPAHTPLYTFDTVRDALQIDTNVYTDSSQFGKATVQFNGLSGVYDVTITTVGENDGESIYNLYINDNVVGSVQNTRTSETFEVQTHVYSNISIQSGDEIRVGSNPHQNFLVPEGGGYAWARARWKSLSLAPIETADTLIAVNCGGLAFTADNGVSYVADDHVSGGSTFNTSDSISGTPDSLLFQSERYGNFSYEVPVPDGSYRVVLQFAEIYATQDRARIFDVSVEGAIEVDDLDIHSLVGHDVAYEVVIPEVIVNDGHLTIATSASVDNAKLSAFRIDTLAVAATFTLIDADTDTDIRVIRNGDTINLATLPTNRLNIRADLIDPPSGVSLSLTGATARLGQIETDAPYTLWGEAAGDYAAGSLNPGQHTVSVTPIGEMAYSINFLVIDLPDGDGSVTVGGDLKQWHRVDLKQLAVQSSELADPNPFRDYRMDVTFTAPSGAEYVVPGYFATDGNGGDAGNVWMAHLNPNEVGEWSYSVSFRSGTDIAVSLDSSEGVAVAPFDGKRDVFMVSSSDKTGDDFRAPGKGMLINRGHHYLTYGGSGKPFLYTGPGIPENILGYRGFANTDDSTHPEFIGHDFDVHDDDWNAGDPDWDNGAGRKLIGALNYIAEQGGNSLYMMSNTIGGDGNDVFPHPTAETTKDRYDLLKLIQWDIALAHAQSKGIFLHWHLAEHEKPNCTYYGGSGSTNNPQGGISGTMTVEKKLSFRMHNAVFGHYNGLKWNIMEETAFVKADRTAQMEYIKAIDPYDHSVTYQAGGLGAVVDTYENHLGEINGINAASFQGYASRLDMFNTIKLWREKSAEAGVKWSCAWDEPQRIDNDDDDTSFGYPQGRFNKMWPCMMAGGDGFLWYVRRDGGNHGFDQRIEDFTIMQNAFNWSGYVRDFLGDLPLLEMEPSLSLVDSSSGIDYTLAKHNQVYAIYNDRAGSGMDLDLSAATGQFAVRWFNPRTGGPLQTGSIAEVSAGGLVSLGNAPSEIDQDWAVLVERADLVSWKEQYSISDLSADDDKDGYSNRFEYYFGMNPKAPGGARSPRVVSGTQYPTLEYARRIDAGPVGYAIWTSDDLTEWTEREIGSSARQLTQVGDIISNGDGSETHSVSFNTPLSELQRQLFFRVSVDD